MIEYVKIKELMKHHGALRCRMYDKRPTNGSYLTVFTSEHADGGKGIVEIKYKNACLLKRAFFENGEETPLTVSDLDAVRSIMIRERRERDRIYAL